MISLLLPPSGRQDCQRCCPLSSDGCYRDSRGVSTTSPWKGILVHRSTGPAASTVVMENKDCQGKLRDAVKLWGWEPYGRPQPPPFGLHRASELSACSSFPPTCNSGTASASFLYHPLHCSQCRVDAPKGPSGRMEGNIRRKGPWI